MVTKPTAIEVRKVRDKLRLTQEEFASLTGLPRSSIAKYERGWSIPPRDVLLAIMRKEFPVKHKE